MSVVQPERSEAVQRTELTGSFNARRAALLSPQLAGLVEQIDVDAGDRVSAGDVLVRLDTDLARLAVARAESAVQERQASLNEALRLRDEGRRLVQDRFVPETEVQAREAGVALAEATLTSSRAELATAQALLDQHRVIAPFDGVIASRRAEIGEWVQTGMPVVELVAVDALWLDIRAPQQYWASLQPDARVQVSVDALPGRDFAALVHARVPVSDPDARTFLVRLSLTEPEADITPGMSARASFEWSRGGEVLRVPRDALTRYPDGTITLWVIDEGQTPPVANEVQVELAASGARFQAGTIEVRSGLNADQAVVVRGNELLSEGQAVRVVMP
ncbi:MAG: efflux RND transporter periplasmic adaptor subunit [Pseudomonadota bacterium]